MEPLPTIDVPRVDQFPSFPPRHPPIAAISDYLLTRLLSADSRTLYADFAKYAGCSYLQNRLGEDPSTGVLVADLGNRSVLRMVLARIGDHYLGGQLYGGFIEGFFRQRGKMNYVAIYMANDACRGFWLRAYTRPV